jgi:transposase InsO family protein
MKQSYHSNATTNVHVRGEIQKSFSTQAHLASQFSVSKKTISKWSKRTGLEDRSSRPHNIKYALSETDKALVKSIRTSSWLPLEAVHEAVEGSIPGVSRSAIYRYFKAEGINTVPAAKKEEAQKFKEYSPGYLHVDVTYLPSFNGKANYLFVAIDRATRLMYFRVYSHKTAANAAEFFDFCMAFFPFGIQKILTDNGLEFTNKLIMSKKGNLCTKPSMLDEKCAQHGIDHRLTKPATPKTNGMVERVNGTIKRATILKEIYESPEEMNNALSLFLVHYIFVRRHSGLVKELKVKTPFGAIQKWYSIQPELFNQSPEEFRQLFLHLPYIT